MTDPRVGLVSCTSKKLTRAATARELYSESPNFRKWKAWVEQTCDRWFVLSAKHHLVHPDEWLAPYNQTLDCAPVYEKRAWSIQVLSELESVLGDVGSCSFEIHAGRNYWAFGLRESLEERGASVSVPAEGLNMFERAAFYSRQPGAPRTPGSDPITGGGSYEPLRAHLAVLQEGEAKLSFEAVEEILGRKLPASAHNYRAWWSNHVGTHSHARSWLDAGWRIESVNLAEGLVVFRRAD